MQRWASVLQESLQHHVQEGSYESAMECKLALDHVGSIMSSMSSTNKEQSLQILRCIVLESVVPMLRQDPPIKLATLVVGAIYRMSQCCSHSCARSFRNVATLLAPFSVRDCSNPSVALAAQDCLHSMSVHCVYDLDAVVAHCRDENDCFHVTRQIPHMTKSWNPEHVLPYHDAVVQVLHTCLQSLGYVTRWYGGHALCALYAFQLEHQTEPVPVDSYQAGLTELNIHEIASHFPWSILALDLQRRSTLAPSDSISTAHTTDLSESESSSESHDTNYSPLGMSPTLKPPGAMLSTFLDQISDQHAWTATQAALAADATLRDQHPPLLHAARLRADALNATVKHNRRTPHDE